VALRRRITAQAHLLQPITGKFTCLVGCKFPYAAEDKTARSPLAVPVLDDVGLRPAQLNPHTEALESTVAGIPFEQISSAGIWPQ
jgi:hypothetical protein